MKTGGKSDNLTTYEDFALRESIQVSNFIGKESEVTVLVSYDFKLITYPNNEPSPKLLTGNSKSLIFYRTNKEMNEFYGYKQAQNMSAIELAWTITFKDNYETVLAFKDGKLESRATETTIVVKSLGNLKVKYLPY